MLTVNMELSRLFCLSLLGFGGGFGAVRFFGILSFSSIKLAPPMIVTSFRDFQ